MKIAILMNHNSYAGREFIALLKTVGIKFEVISIGHYPPYNYLEEKRCNKLWQPKAFEELIKKINHYNFPFLNSKKLVDFLKEKKYDLGIQGGTGIIKKEIFGKFRLGILNFHPGDLPKYRGCTAPEWQIYEAMPVICSCHLIDAGIDSGPIYKKKKLKLNYKNYHTMRANVYSKIAKFLVEVLQEIINYGGFIHEPIEQNEAEAFYRKPIDKEKLNYIKKRLKY